MREGTENIVGLHAARGCRCAVQASKGMYQAFTDTVMVQGAEKTQMLGGHRLPRDNQHYKTPFDGRKMRRSNENIVGLDAASAEALYKHSRTFMISLTDIILVQKAEITQILIRHRYPREMKTTKPRSSSVKCVRATEILLVNTP